MEDFDISSISQQQDGAPSRTAKKPSKSKKRREKRDGGRIRLSGSKRKDSSTADEFFGREILEAPTDTAELYSTRTKKARRLRFGLIAIVYFGFPLMLLINLIYIAQEVSTDGAVAVEATQTYSENKPLAIQEVQEYLEQDPPPLPGVTLSGWDYVETTFDGAKRLENSDMSDDEVAQELPEAVTYETHYLTLTSETGAFYTAAVEIASSQVSGAWVTSPVSVTSQAPPSDDGQSNSSESFPQRESITEGRDDIEAAAASWAENYFSADPEALKQAVGDGRDETSYMPMPEAEDIEVSVEEMVASNDAEYDDDSDRYDRLLARVSVIVTWPNADEGIAGLVEANDEDDDSESDAGDDDKDVEEHVAEFSYDVLVDSADTATPVVTAWGPAGSAEELKDYGNAISHRTIEAVQE